MYKGSADGLIFVFYMGCSDSLHMLYLCLGTVADNGYN